MSYFVRPLRFFLFGLTLLASSRAAAAVSPKASSQAFEPITLQLKWAHQFQFAGYYAAIEKGYYREAGLRVSVQEAVVGVEPSTAVLGGEAQYGIATSDLLLLRAKGEPVVVLAPIYQHSPLVFIASKRSGIQHIHDFAGRRVGIEPHADELYAYLHLEGIERSQLQLETHHFDPDSLIDGTLDALSAYTTDERFLLDQAGLEYQIFSPRAGGIDFYGDTLYTTEKEIAEHPERVRAFVEASLRGWAYALDHPEEIVQLIYRQYSQRHSLDHLRFEAEQSRRLILPEVVELGYNNPGRWRHIAQTYATLGMVPTDLSLEGFLYDLEPHPNLERYYFSIALTLTIVALLTIVVLHYRRLIRRLRTEVEQRQQLTAEMESLSMEQKLVLEHAQVGIGLIRDRKIVWGNPTLARMVGKTRETLVNTSTRVFYQSDADYERIGALYAETLRQGGSIDVEIPMIDLHAGTRTVRLLGKAVDPSDPFRGAIFILHDVTEARAAADALRQAKESAERATEMKSAFLAHVSHEIRTPLNGIIGIADALHDDLRNRPEQREFCEIIVDSARTLLELLNDLLDSARMEAGKLNIAHEPFDLLAEIRQVLQLFRLQARNRNLGLGFRHDDVRCAHLLGDAVRVRQILSNLVANALKFTQQGEVTVAASSFETSPGRAQVEIRVIDTGMGIAAERLSNIFEDFTQADDSIVRSFGGSGLGLSISRQLALLMGGDLRAESEVGKGSVFILTLQLETCDEA